MTPTDLVPPGTSRKQSSMGTDKLGMENEKVRSISEQLSRVHRELTDATTNADEAVRALRGQWVGEDAKTFFTAWPTTLHTLESSSSGVDTLVKKLREEIGEQELTSGVSGAGGDSDADGRPDGRDGDDDNDGTPDDQDEDPQKAPDNHNRDPEEADDQDGDGHDDNSDEDDDNDGVPDEDDHHDDNDTDGDGESNADDTDDDNDGIPDEDDAEHRDGGGVWDEGGIADPELNAGMTFAEGEKQLWDAGIYDQTWGDEDGNHLTVEALSTEGTADYQLGLSQDGLVAAGSLSAGLYAAKVSGAYSNSYGTSAEGKAYVGAEANADAGVTLGTDGVKANVGGEVFAGGKAEASVSQDLGPVDVGVGGEISYGIGAHAEADAEFSADNVGVSVDVGATLGIGGGIKFDIGFDPPW